MKLPKLIANLAFKLRQEIFSDEKDSTEHFEFVMSVCIEASVNQHHMDVEIEEVTGHIFEQLGKAQKINHKVESIFEKITAGRSLTTTELITIAIANFQKLYINFRLLKFRSQLKMIRAKHNFPTKVYVFHKDTVAKLEQSSKTVQLQKPPGHELLRVADFLYSAKNYKEVFEPHVAEWRCEYFEALKQGLPEKAAWISIRNTWGFFRIMFALSFIGQVIRVVIGLISNKE